MRNDVVRSVEKIVKLVMPQDPVHGYPHVERVLRISKRLRKKCNEPFDDEVLDLAILLHDIGRYSSKGLKDHAYASSEAADIILSALNYPQEKKAKVLDAIIAHSFSSKRMPATPEAKILSDADKLDALGSIGIIRVFLYSCQINRKMEAAIQHFYDKILKLPQLMKTSAGKEEAEKRVKIVKEFLEELKRELNF